MRSSQHQVQKQGIISTGAQSPYLIQGTQSYQVLWQIESNQF